MAHALLRAVSRRFSTHALLRRVVELIQGYGLEQMREPHVKHLEGPLWEMRMKGKDGVSRAIYVTARGRRVVAVRVFIKKSAGLNQEQVAHRMKTTQAVVARLEGGGSKPSTRTLERYAEATGSRLKISFEAEAG